MWWLLISWSQSATLCWHRTFKKYIIGKYVYGKGVSMAISLCMHMYTPKHACIVHMHVCAFLNLLVCTRTHACTDVCVFF